MIESAYNFPNVERHVYDVDAFEILDRLRDKYLKEEGFVTEQMLLLEEENLHQLLDDEGYNTKEHQKYRNFILPSNFNQYNHFLAYKLLTIDLYKIEPLLSYQSVLFLGNYYAVKENFIGLLEFLVYDFVQKRVLPNEQVRLEKIVNWLERNRIFLITKAYNEDEEASNNPPQRKIIMDPTFAIILCEKLKCFFEGQEKQLYNLLIKDESQDRLVFNRNLNSLVELFKRLRYNSKISVASFEELAQWIEKHFAIRNKQKEVIHLKIDTISQVLRKTKAEPIKAQRILLEVAEYVAPNLRKKTNI